VGSFSENEREIKFWRRRENKILEEEMEVVLRTLGYC